MSTNKNLFLLLVVILVIVGAWLVASKKDLILSLLNPVPAETAMVYPEAKPRTYEEPMALPKPRLTGGMALERAIQERRSRREFTSTPVTLPQLSQVLWAAQGITDPATGHRAAPSARGAYPFTVFVVVRNVTGLTPGLYEYLPESHSLGDLKLVNAGELLDGSGVQAGAQESPVVFVLAAAYGNVQKTLGESVVSSSLLEAGHIGQNMYLQTESLNMGMVVMGGFDAEKVGAALNLDPALTVVYIMPFGQPVPEE